jgi:hypothetical protein
MSVPLIVSHVGGCPARAIGHTDGARRIADACTMHWLAIGWDSSKYWVAFRLEDGRSPDNNTLYDSKRHAVSHLRNGAPCVFIKLHPGGVNVCEAGNPYADPEHKHGGYDIIPRIGMDKVRNQINALVRGK